MVSSAAMKALGVLAAVLVFFSLIGGALAYKQVPEGHEGVTKEWGAVTGQTLDPGAHWKIPVAQGVQNVEVRPRTYTMSDTEGEGKKSGRADAITVQTINGTSVDVDVTVRYHINPDRANVFVSEWNNEEQMEQRLIRPTVRSQMRDEAAAIQTTEIYTAEGRERLAAAARAALSDQFDGQPIVLEAVQVREVDLPQAYDDALDAKEIAKQRVQQEQYKVQQAKQRKRQRIVEAEARAESKLIEANAEAEAVSIRAQAYEDHPVMLEVRRIEAYDEGTIFVVPQNESAPVILDAEDGS